METKDDSPFITIYIEDIEPFLKQRDIKKLIVRYLHDRGIEAEVGKDEKGEFIKYYKPPEEEFDEFSHQLYEFITKGGK